MTDEELTLGQKIGAGVFGLAIVPCSLEMVPGWGIFGLDWPPSTFITIMAICGAFSGFLIGHHHRLPGSLGGLVCGSGALLTIAFVLERTTAMYGVFLILLGAIGAVPGLLLYAALAAVENAIFRRRHGSP